ncbi:MAG: hypothetical protein HY063_03175 [Bacteroidetes bacterium]|nr:hypothetical protein [Bacteroidota bacterium]
MKRKTKWKNLTPAQEEKIIDDYYSGLVRTKIILKHKIPEGQLYSILKKINT